MIASILPGAVRGVASEHTGCPVTVSPLEIVLARRWKAQMKPATPPRMARRARELISCSFSLGGLVVVPIPSLELALLLVWRWLQVFWEIRVSDAKICFLGNCHPFLVLLFPVGYCLLSLSE